MRVLLPILCAAVLFAGTGAETRTTGRVTNVDAKTVTVAAADGRVLVFERTARTRVFTESPGPGAAQIQPGDQVTVEAIEGPGGRLEASRISIEKRVDVPATNSAPRPAAPDPADPGPPMLKHGAHPRAAAPDIDDAEPAGAAAPVREAPPPEADDPVLAKARAAAGAFTEKLPDYLCKEFMARYQSDSRPVEWRALDVVSADVIYEGNKERYGNVSVNGKPARKEIDQIGGSWSTGEFGTILRGLFSPATAASFHFRRNSFASGVSAQVYAFEVERERSDWDVRTQSQSIRPAYKGSIWIDPSTGRVLRIEMQATALPSEFPLDTVESSVDYQPIRIGDGQFLLPVHAESLACQRGTSSCSRNAIDFRNYHKYNADSSVSF